MNKNSLKNFMSAQQKASLGNLPTFHTNCIEKTGVARPGKTNKDRFRKENRNNA